MWWRRSEATIVLRDVSESEESVAGSVVKSEAIQPLPHQLPPRCKRVFSPRTSSSAACDDNAGRSGGPRRGRIAGAAGRTTCRLRTIGSDWPGTIDLFLLLGQRDQVGGSTPSIAKGRQGRVELPLAAVDQEDVGERLVVAPAAAWIRRVTTSRIEAKSSTPCDALDLVAAIAGLEGQAVDERHQRADRLGAAQVGDVHAVDRSGGSIEVEDLPAAPSGPCAGRRRRPRAGRAWSRSPRRLRFSRRLDLVAEPGGLLELEGLARLAHLLFHLARGAASFLPSRKRRRRRMSLAVVLAIDPQVARRRALVDRVQQAGAEPAPARVVLLDVQRAGAELEDPLQHLDRAAQALGPGERAVELDAAVERLAGEVDAGEVLAGA